MNDGEAPATDPLLDLQELDLAVDRLEHRRAELEGGEEVRAARRQADELEERLGGLRLALDSVGREQTRLDTEIDSFSRKMADEEKRLYDGSVANPRELEAIRHELTNLANRKRRVEDELLDQMEKREQLEHRIVPLEGELAEARERLGELAGHAEVELAEVVASLVERRAERDALRPRLDEDRVELYDDLRAQKKGIGAAALEGRVCQACRTQLSALEYEQVKKADGIRRCPNCRRILVLT